MNRVVVNTRRSYQLWFFYPSFQAAAQAKIKTFLCPSDNPQSAPIGSVGIGTFNVSINTLDVTDNGAFGRTNYLGCDGYVGVGNGFDQFAGIMTNRARNTMVGVSDGLSNTFMFGEALGDAEVGNRQYAFTWMGCGTMWTGYGIAAANDPSGWAGFGSKHSGIVNFTMGDGSVRTVRKYITANPQFSTYVYISAMRDGLVVDANSIMN